MGPVALSEMKSCRNVPAPPFSPPGTESAIADGTMRRMTMDTRSTTTPTPSKAWGQYQRLARRHEESGDQEQQSRNQSPCRD